MTPEEQRIAIAEVCGYRRAKQHTYSYYSYFDPTGLPIGNYYWPEMPEGKPGIPDYLNDLNAMHEAEKLLKSEQHFTFQVELARVIDTITYPLNFALLHATATQRAEAFLRTLNLYTP